MSGQSPNISDHAAASSRMSSRERWLAALECKPVDRLPFWPKLDQAYMQWNHTGFSGRSVKDFHHYFRSDQHDWLDNAVEITFRRCAFQEERSKDTRVEKFITPSHTLQRIMKWDVPSQSWHPVAMPVASEMDIDIFREWLDDQTPALNPERLANQQSQYAKRTTMEDGICVVNLGESPLMEWVEWIAGVENAHFLLADCQDSVASLFTSMQQLLMRKAELIAAHVCADLIYMIENTSSTLISPEQYRLYCLPHLQQLNRIVQAHGRRFALHMCGTLKLMLPDIRRVGAQAFEAFTSPTLGDTRLLDGRLVCPETCLIGGTNATLWLQPAKKIIETLERDLGELPHHRGIVVTSGGIMTPLCPPERIREVREWLQHITVRM